MSSNKINKQRMYPIKPKMLESEFAEKSEQEDLFVVCFQVVTK